MWNSPVIERELRLASRKWQTFWGRTGAGAMAMLFASGFFMAQGQFAVASAGANTFQTVTIVAVFYVLGTIFKATAPAFVREKVGDTLGLLLLTPLRPWEILLGKLGSTALPTIYQLVAMLPVLGLPILAGGITLGNFLTVMAGLLHLIFLGAAIGLWTSATLWDENQAAGVAGLIFFIIVAIVPGALALLAHVFLGGQEYALFALSPIYPVWHGIGARGGGNWELWVSLLCSQGWTWFFIWITCRILPTCWRKPENTRGLTAPLNENRPRRTVAKGEAAKRVHVSLPRKSFSPDERRKLLDENPALWLTLRRKPSFLLLWLLGGVAVCIPFVSALVTGEFGLICNPIMIFFLCLLYNAVALTFVRRVSCSVFAADQADNPLDLLLATTLQPAVLVEGALEALRGKLERPLRIMLWIEAGWLVLSLAINWGREELHTWILGAASAAMLAMFPWQARMVQWWGLWKGVASRNAKEAESEAGTPSVLPWLLFVVCFLLGQVANFYVAFVLGLTIWVISSWLTTGWVVERAQEHFQSDLYLWARRRALGETKDYGLWKRLGRWVAERTVLR